MLTQYVRRIFTHFPTFGVTLGVCRLKGHRCLGRCLRISWANFNGVYTPCKQQGEGGADYTLCIYADADDRTDEPKCVYLGSFGGGAEQERAETCCYMKRARLFSCVKGRRGPTKNAHTLRTRGRTNLPHSTHNNRHHHHHQNTHARTKLGKTRLAVGIVVSIKPSLPVLCTQTTHASNLNARTP